MVNSTNGFNKGPTAKTENTERKARKRESAQTQASKITLPELRPHSPGT